MQPNGQPKSAAGGPEKVSQLGEFGHEPQVPPLKLGILIFMFLCEYYGYSHSFHLVNCSSPSKSCDMQRSSCRLYMYPSTFPCAYRSSHTDGVWSAVSMSATPRVLKMAIATHVGRYE